jgi:two-component system, cell cycle sensor histidine kinase and response regulator CckA
VGFRAIQVQRNRHKAPVIIMLAGMLLMAVLYREGRQSALENLHKEFTVDAAMRAGMITNALQDHCLDLEGLQRFYHASSQVDRRQFNQFVAPALKTRPGIQAFEWIPRVPRAERARFEAEARRDGLPSFQCYQLDAKGNHIPVEPRAYYYPVYYVEPLAGNEPAVGFDLGSNPARLAALDQARDTGQPVATERITLVQETGTQAGFLILLPVYRQEMPLASVAQRRLALQGFVLGVFRAGDTMEAGTRLLPDTYLRSELLDLSAPSDKRLLARTAKESWHLHTAAWENWLVPAVSLGHEHSFTFGGRQWQVDIAATPAYVHRHISLSYWLIPPFGIGVTLLLALYLGTLISHQARADNLVVERTSALENTTNMLSQIINIVPQAIFWKDRHGVFRGCNRKFAQAAGLENLEVIIGQTDDNLPWSKDERDLYLHNDLQIMEENRPQYHVMKTLSPKDGVRLWIDTTKIPIQTIDGTVIGVLGIFEDVTERQLVEQALRENEEKYRLLVSQIPAMVFRGQADWSIDPLDEKVEALTGYSKEDFEARRVKWCDLIPAEDLDYAAGVFIEALKTDKSYVREHRLRKKNGDIIWVQCRGRIFCDAQGKVDHISGVSFDVTRRHQAEEAVRESERFLHSIFSSIQDGISVLDREYNILRVNEAMEQAYAPALPLVGKKCYAAFHGRREPCEICPTRSALATGEAARALIEEKGAAGEIVRFVELYSFPMPDIASGQILGVVEYVRDVTARQQAEEALRRSETQLGQAVKMEAVGRLAGGVAHDFNNILTAITSYGELLLMNHDLKDPVRQDVQDILAAAERAASLTRQLLAFSRKQVLQPQRLDLNRVVTNLDKMLRRIIGEDINLVTVTSPELGTVMADPGQIEQVIMNLVVNARDAMPQGGNLTIETANAELDEGYAQRRVVVQPGPYVMLAVIDTGVGLDRESRDRIFEPFFTTKELGQGTGLGLSTVYGIIKQSGGYIWVYSEPGRGTTFKIYLPRLETPGESAVVSQAPDRCWWGTETILLVEDEDLVRQVTGRILAQHGYTVLEVPDGQEAQRVSQQHPGPIHLMLTDVVMPGMSGPELAGKLKSMRPQMQVLFMSGHTENAIVHHGALDPGIAFIQKPFRYDTLARKIRGLLESSRDK